MKLFRKKYKPQPRGDKGRFIRIVKPKNDNPLWFNLICLSLGVPLGILFQDLFQTAIPDATMNIILWFFR